MTLGPGTEIQVTGNLFWRKIGLPICSPICWDFFADLGAGLYDKLSKGGGRPRKMQPHWPTGASTYQGSHAWGVTIISFAHECKQVVHFNSTNQRKTQQCLQQNC